jgi:hypothetical protein
MSIYYSARVIYANGIGAQGVQVQIFDRDAPGETDDDLTVTPCVSDSSGFFELEYDTARARDTHLVTRTVPANPPFDWTPVKRTTLEPDPTDDYQPYLRFTYTQNGQAHTGTAALRTSQKEYRLPAKLEKTLIPSQHAFKFVNSFSGFFLPFALPALPGLGNPDSVYGLCGGMSASTLDFFLANRAIPADTKVPENGKPIQRYLYKRQLDSLGRLGEVVFRFTDWMGLPDATPHGTQKRTQDEFEKIRTRLNHFTPVPIGLLYVKWSDTNQVWQNHQVLALGYTRDAQQHIKMQIYDPNYPLRDDIFIEAERVPVGNGVFGLRCQQRIGGSSKKLYAFFAMPYQPVIPPVDI